LKLKGQVVQTSGAGIKVVIEVGCRGTGRERKPNTDHPSRCKRESRQHLEVRRFAYFEICTVHELSEIVHRVVVEWVRREDNMNSSAHERKRR